LKSKDVEAAPTLDDNTTVRFEEKQLNVRAKAYNAGNNYQSDEDHNLETGRFD